MRFDSKVLLAGLAPALMAATAYAAEPGFYIGASGGQTTMEASTGRVNVDDPIINPPPLRFEEFDLDGEETAYKGYVGYQFNPWFGIEGGYVELGSVSKDFSVGNTRVDAELDVGGWEGFLVGTLPLGDAFDVFVKVGGFTGDISLDGDLHFPGGQQESFEGDTDNSDAILAYGGGLAWNFGGGHWSLRAEYEGYDADHVEDLYVVSAGIVYRFFDDHPKSAPPPQPVAAAPAGCSDADGDGVCNTADQCPNTKPGARVGRAGCDCDYTMRTHFAFDSAELTAEDKTQLDQLAVVLKKPELHFVAGEIDGYTDDVGEAAYNEKLSKRRAEAVAAYLRSKGVALGAQFVTNGFGEADPVADNKSESGRAQNRRATIRRTDCGPAN